MSSPSHTSSSSRRTHLTSPTRAPRLDIPGHRPMPQPDGEPSGDDTPSYIVISGGTGCNAICAAFAHASYVLPVSDDGGSSSEIIRVLGGPSIGELLLVISLIYVIVITTHRTHRRHSLASRTFDPACATWNTFGCRENVTGTSSSVRRRCRAGCPRRVADHR